MPNHVTTLTTVTGSEADVALFERSHVVPVGNEQAEDRVHRIGQENAVTIVMFDLETVIPMPEILKETKASSATDDALYALGAPGHELTVDLFRYTFLSEDVRAGGRAAFLAWLAKHRPASLFDARRAIAAKAETGFENWYDWSCARWGTKWNAYGYDRVERSPGRLVFRFETAWSFPTPIFKALALRYPTLVFDVASFDEGWNFGCLGRFAGEYHELRSEKRLATREHHLRVYGVLPDDEEEKR